MSDWAPQPVRQREVFDAGDVIGFRVDVIDRNGKRHSIASGMPRQVYEAIGDLGVERTYRELERRVISEATSV